MSDVTAASEAAQSSIRIARRRYLIGILMVVGGAVCLSIAGVTLRFVEQADGWQLLFYRSIIFSATLLIWLVLRYRTKLPQAFREVGWMGILIAAVMGTSFVGYLLALTLTTVATAMVVMAAGPVCVALMGWAILKERVGPRTWFAIAVAVAGLVVTVVEGIGGGSLAGILFAFLAIFTFSLMIVLLRGGRATDMLPAAFLAGLIAAAISATQVDSFALTPHDFNIALILGIVQNAGGFVLLALGTRYVPVAQIGLLGLTEPVLAILWAWLGANEVPTMLTMIGGICVIGAVAFNAAAGLKQPHPDEAAP
ncbi:MAG: DMT family transporter [Rhodospirillaceae bacterium]|nr:DMT family transporter [Rhodospirillaceae bacterium]